MTPAYSLWLSVFSVQLISFSVCLKGFKFEESKGSRENRDSSSKCVNKGKSDDFYDLFLVARHAIVGEPQVQKAECGKRKEVGAKNGRGDGCV